ncbi:MAG: hypothetical protein HUK04_00355 [Bacteroidaceae bacterium]|nr:hypothetical protein [Bacteroidaceae bacterium]
MSKVNQSAVAAFEQFLWDNFHPGEVLECFCEDATKAIDVLASALEIDPDLIDYPLSPVVVDYVRDAYSQFRSPVEKRGEFDPKEFYSGEALSMDDFVEVARRIQPEIIPER